MTQCCPFQPDPYCDSVIVGICTCVEDGAEGALKEEHNGARAVVGVDQRHRHLIHDMALPHLQRPDPAHRHLQGPRCEGWARQGVAARDAQSMRAGAGGTHLPAGGDAGGGR